MACEHENDTLELDAKVGNNNKIEGFRYLKLKVQSKVMCGCITTNENNKWIDE